MQENIDSGGQVDILVFAACGRDKHDLVVPDCPPPPTCECAAIKAELDALKAKANPPASVEDEEHNCTADHEEQEQKVEKYAGSSHFPPPPPFVRELAKSATPVDEAGAPTPTESVQRLLERLRSRSGCSHADTVWQLDLCTESQMSVLAGQIDKLTRRVDELETHNKRLAAAAHKFKEKLKEKN